MSDRLPRLLPNDPKNLLSVEARKRIERAHIQSQKYILKAEISIDKFRLDPIGHKANALRNEAFFNKAKSVLSVLRKEFSQLNISEPRYREIMREEIEGASNSFQLSMSQRYLLENEFYYPEEKNTPIVLPVPPTPTVGKQINALRNECRLSVEQLAEKIGIEPRSVQRHIADSTAPYPRHLRKYETEFSKLLNRKIVISNLS